jgi:type VI protein secretion system component VasK
MSRFFRPFQFICLVVGLAGVLVFVYLPEFVGDFKKLNQVWQWAIPVMAIFFLSVACGLQIFLPRREWQEKRVPLARSKYIRDEVASDPGRVALATIHYKRDGRKFTDTRSRIIAK